MNNIKAIVFDVGGVLSPDIIETKLTDLANKYNKNPMELIDISPKYRVKADSGEISDQEYWQQVLAHFKIEACPEDCNIDSYLTLIPDTLELVLKLKKHYQVAILSNDSREMSTIRRKKFGFDKVFDLVLISCYLGMVKPQFQIYDTLVQELCLAPQQCIFIDDRQENIDMAANRGLKPILFQNVAQLQTELLQMGVAF